MAGFLRPLAVVYGIIDRRSDGVCFDIEFVSTDIRITTQDLRFQGLSRLGDIPNLASHYQCADARKEMAAWLTIQSGCRRA